VLLLKISTRKLQMGSEIAKILLEIQAVHLSPDDFFTWTSGIKSPIYCDNRKIISYPAQREIVVNEYINHIKENHPNVEVIAGTATAGIPWASFIAQKMDLPLIYVRSSIKAHGLNNAIEGHYQEGQKVILIEDLISTGKSSIKAGLDLRAVKLDLLSVVSIFNYGFELAKDQFQKNTMNYHSLSDLDAMLEFARAKNLLSEQQIAIIKAWKTSIVIN